MLTGRPFDPSTATSSPPIPPGMAPAPGAAATPAQTGISTTPAATGSQPIVVLPAPVVVVPSKPDVKKSRHNSQYRPGQLMRNLGNRLNRALPSFQGGGS
jgi:hypothetical protein